MIERIVSLEPSITRTLIDLEQRKKLVGVSPYCSRVADVAGIAEVESTWSVDAATVAALEPDLVIGGVPFGAGKVDDLLRAGLQVLCLNPKSLTDVHRAITLIGAVSGAADAALRQIAAMKERLAERAADAAQSGWLPRVYVEIWPKPMMTATWWGKEIVEALGAEFVPGEPQQQLDDERLFDIDPDVIIAAWAGAAQINTDRIIKRAGWDRLTAVQNGRVHAVDEVMINAPGTNLGAGIDALYRTIWLG
ncbi:MAG: ABC transporter substrate-binding protein [Chloroflexi bacterium]|nr:ABC transporter substrate-binding protein [Chloroflexota bacterium]